MKILELFAGSRSVGKVADKLGFDSFSIDIKPFEGISLVKDILHLKKEDLPFVPNAIWASPVCSAWSKTGWFHHWDTNIYRLSEVFVPKSQFAKESIAMVAKTIEIFSWFPDATFFMENPEGMLYKHPIMNKFVEYGIYSNLRREKVTYCQYGHTTMKPTHIWTNSQNWEAKPPCKNGDKCHMSAPRCTKKGLLSVSNSYERSIVPEALCLEILQSLEYATLS